MVSSVGISLLQRRKAAMLRMLGLVVELVLLMLRENNRAKVLSNFEAERVANCGAG